MSPNKMSPAPQEMITLFERVIKTVPGAQVRKMFGYPTAFINGNMFAGLHDNYMIVKLAPDDLKMLMQSHKTHLFEPMPGRPMKEYVVIPPAIINSEPELVEWLGKSFDYVNSFPAKQPKKKKK